MRVIREPEAELQDEGYMQGFTNMSSSERQAWIKDINNKLYKLEPLPPDEAPARIKKPRKRRRVDGGMVEDKEVLDGVGQETDAQVDVQSAGAELGGEDAGANGSTSEGEKKVEDDAPQDADASRDVENSGPNNEESGTSQGNGNDGIDEPEIASG